MQLRNNQASFTEIRALSPTRYRFRVIDANGCDIRYRHNPITASEDTRVSCAEPASGTYFYRMDGLQRLFIGSMQVARLSTAAQPCRYRADVAYHQHGTDDSFEQIMHRHCLPKAVIQRIDL